MSSKSNADGKALPPGWLNVQLSEFGDLYCGQSPSVPQVNSDSRGVPYVSGPEQWNGHTLHIDKWTEYPKRSVPSGCIFITVKGAGVGKIFPGIECAIGRDIYAFHSHSELDPKYVFYALKYSIDQIVVRAQGDIPGLSKAHILDHQIGLPGIQEQQRIVTKIEELFSELDKGVESLTTASEQLKAYRQAILKHAFEGELTADWRAKNQDKLEAPEVLFSRIRTEREACYAKTLANWQQAVAQSRAEGEVRRRSLKPARPDVQGSPDMPVTLATRCTDNWAWLRLVDIADVSGGLTKNPKRNALPLKMKYLRVANVYADSLELNDVTEIGVTHDEFDALKLKAGDILVVEGNGSVDQIGRVAVWGGEIANVGHQNHLIRVRMIPGMSPRFYLSYLMSPLGRDLIVRQASSTSGLHTLSISKVSNLPVPVPSAEEQEAILAALAAQLSEIEKFAEEIELGLARCSALRQSILKKAFSGQLVAQNPNDESASVLVERIKAEKEVNDDGRKKNNNSNKKEAA
jgi:type I restriction enzyme S subunit